MKAEELIGEGGALKRREYIGIEKLPSSLTITSRLNDVIWGSGDIRVRYKYINYIIIVKYNGLQ